MQRSRRCPTGRDGATANSAPFVTRSPRDPSPDPRALSERRLAEHYAPLRALAVPLAVPVLSGHCDPVARIKCHLKMRGVRLFGVTACAGAVL
jgi:hypothetical protein